MPVIDQAPVVSEPAKWLQEFIKTQKKTLRQKDLSRSLRRFIKGDIEKARAQIPFQETLAKGRWRARINSL